MTTFNAMKQMILAPYEPALALVTDAQSLVDWNQQVFPDRFEDINAEIAPLGVEDIKNVIRRELLAMHEIGEETNPWNIENFFNRGVDAEGKPVISVSVVNGPNSFEHLLTEEQARGIALGLDGQPGWALYVAGVPLVVDFFVYNTEGPYLATVNGTQRRFSTPNFVQGLITAAQWTDRDPHAMVQDLQQVTENGQVSLTF